MSVSRWCLASSVVWLLFVGCSNGTGAPEALPRAKASGTPAIVPIRQPPMPILAATRLAAAEPRLARLLAPRVEGWKREGQWATSPGWRTAARRRFDDLGARLPDRADEPREVGISRFERFRLRLTAEGAASSPMQLHEGRAVYADAWPSTDIVIATTRDRYEEFIVLRDEAAPREFAWNVETPRGIKAVRRDADGGVTFADARGETVLHLAPAFALDARGERRDMAMEWSDGRLALRVDTRGLVYPVLVDPAFETSVWTLMTPTTYPPARVWGALAYDSARGKTVLFGGNPSAGNTLDDTWEWDGTNWSQKLPATNPGPTLVPALAYDSARGRTVLFRGENWGSAGETWEWDGTNWSQKSPLASAPALQTALAYDSTRGRTVLFGGANGVTQTPSSETWEWDGTTWELRRPTTKAPPRAAHALAYDSARGKTVLFGGGDGVATCVTETWEWDGTTWSWMKPAKSPSARRTALAYDSARGRTVLFGGESDTQPPFLGDTWEWDGTEWTLMTPTTSPPGRRLHALAYDSQRRRVVLFGGVNANYLSGTWEYHARGSTCSEDTQCDTGLCVDGVCCETTCLDPCKQCDGASTPGICATVVEAPDPDTCATPDVCNATGACLLSEGRPCTLASQCISGFCVDGVCCNLACTGQCEACNVASNQGKCAPVIGAPHGSVRAACTGTGSCAGACDGKDTFVCKYPTGICATTCEKATETASACDGQGTCVVGNATPCPGNFVCEGTVKCKTACTVDGDCAQGYGCSAAHTCDPKGGATCDGEHTLISLEGSDKDCSPYKCSTANVCLNLCTSRADCVTGMTCTADGKCEPSAEPEPSSDSGCGCRQAGGRSSKVFLLLVAAAMIVTRRGRRPTR
jgi:hypothetical protein